MRVFDALDVEVIFSCNAGRKTEFYMGRSEHADRPLARGHFGSFRNEAKNMHSEHIIYASHRHVCRASDSAIFCEVLYQIIFNFVVLFLFLFTN